MAFWFWIIVGYSLLGYLLEKLFAWATHSPQQTRKCLLLPLCPVYGLAMAAILLLPPELTATLPRLIVFGALTATVTEYVLHLFYERVLHVYFWDYSHAKANLRGRVCLSFSLLWGVLAALTVRFVQPLLARFALAVPPWLTFAALLLVTADAVLSAFLLRQTRDVDILGYAKLYRTAKEERRG